MNLLLIRIIISGAYYCTAYETNNNGHNSLFINKLLLKGGVAGAED